LSLYIFKYFYFAVILDTLAEVGATVGVAIQTLKSLLYGVYIVEINLLLSS